MTNASSTAPNILSSDAAASREDLVRLLTEAYWMEIETVMNYIANSTNPDGVRAQEVIDSLAADITEELGHAQLFAQRIKVLYGTVPGSHDFRPSQDALQPPADAIDITHVIRGVIDAERGAVEHYSRIIQATDGIDPVTQDMVTTILADEQRHLRTFEGFLREYEDSAR